MPRSAVRAPKLGVRAQGSAWRDTPHALSEDAREKLATLIGLNSSDDPEALAVVFTEVSRLLGIYPGAVQAIDNAPRPSDYSRSFRELASQARDLQRGLNALTPHLREQLDACVMAEPTRRLGDAESAIRDLIAALDDGSKRWAGVRVGSSGRPKQNALRLVVGGLSAVFRQRYRGPRESGAAITNRGELEKHEGVFIKVALADAHIVVRDLGKLLRSLARAEPTLSAADRKLLGQITRAAKTLRRSR
jgi:hypothetical protein